MNKLFTNMATNLTNCQLVQRIGQVSKISGLLVESTGPDAFLGEECEIYNTNYGVKVKAEVVSLRDGKVLLMPYSDMRGVSLGNEVIATGRAVSVPVGKNLLGRVIDGFGNPLDDLPKPKCTYQYPLFGEPMNPLSRQRINSVLETGVKVIDSLTTIGKGQRIGIFSGSGVGKSSLIGMIARHASADVNVIALVGERGREVIDFIEESLGQDGLAKSVIVVATSDQSALTRSHAALAATSIAEFFRDQGLHVILMMDSLTRYAMALREIGLAVGEPPTTRGYTPSVFASLPKLLERCGTSNTGGSITALYSVLVEGDDMNDPVVDNVRAILDGHLVLDRKLANKYVYPPVDALTSISRLMNDLISENELELAASIRKALSVYSESKDILDIGMYKPGSNPDLDFAVKVVPELQKCFSQKVTETCTRQQAIKELRVIMSGQ